MKHYKTLPAKLVQKERSHFDKSFKNVRKSVINLYGQAFADQVMGQTRSEFEKLLPQTPSFDGLINIFNKVVMFNTQMVAFYKAMKANGKSAEETVKIYYT